MLKECEDKLICRLGAFNGSNGLNTRDEIKARYRIHLLEVRLFSSDIWQYYFGLTINLTIFCKYCLLFSSLEK